MARRLVIWFVGLGCFAAITAYCLKTVPSQFISGLENNIDSVFTEAGYSDIEYNLRGRDVIFTGQVSAWFDRVGLFRTARGVPGVRNIVDHQDLYQPIPAFGQIHIENGIAEFAGDFKIPETIDRITKLMYKYFPDHDVVIKARIIKRMIPMQLTLDFDYLLPHFRGNAVWIQFSDEMVVLNGRFASEHALARVEQKILSQISTQTRYMNDIQILGTDASETLVFEKTPERIIVKGELAEQDLKNKLVKLFGTLYPDTQVDFDVTINGELQHVHWYKKLGFLVPELDRLIEGRLRLYLEEIVLEGTVDSLSTKSGLVSRVRESFEDSVIIDKLKVVNS